MKHVTNRAEQTWCQSALDGVARTRTEVSINEKYTRDSTHATRKELSGIHCHHRATAVRRGPPWRVADRLDYPRVDQRRVGAQSVTRSVDCRQCSLGALRS